MSKERNHFYLGITAASMVGASLFLLYTAHDLDVWEGFAIGVAFSVFVVAIIVIALAALIDWED